MTNTSVKYEVFIKQYLHASLGLFKLQLILEIMMYFRRTLMASKFKDFSITKLIQTFFKITCQVKDFPRLRTLLAKGKTSENTEACLTLETSFDKD